MRTHCPSCHQRLSPLAMECPVCGLSLLPQGNPRPLLFQASALRKVGVPEPRRQAIATPALGRIAPVAVPVEGLPEPAVTALPSAPEPQATLAGGSAAGNDSLWPLVKLEFLEGGLLLGVNVLLAVVTVLLTGPGLAHTYGELWPWLLPLHLSCSWALFMVPLVLAGQSPLMGRCGLLLDSTQPERRLTFSLFHLLSVVCFPVSFLCLVLTREHRTLAELLTGQEILQRALPRMR